MDNLSMIFIAGEDIHTEVTVKRSAQYRRRRRKKNTKASSGRGCQETRTGEHSSKGIQVVQRTTGETFKITVPPNGI